MSHFHIFVRKEGDTALGLFARDLTEEEVARRIAKPYRRGTSIVHGGMIVPVGSLRELRICKTDATFEQAYSMAHADHCRHMDELNRDGAVFFVSAGPGHDDMADTFEDVTDRFLRGEEPGHRGGLSLLSAIAKHPLVSTVLGGLVLAGLVFCLGWN